VVVIVGVIDGVILIEGVMLMEGVIDGVILTVGVGELQMDGALICPPESVVNTYVPSLHHAETFTGVVRFLSVYNIHPNPFK